MTRMKLRPPRKLRALEPHEHPDDETHEQAERRRTLAGLVVAMGYDPVLAPGGAAVRAVPVFSPNRGVRFESMGEPVRTLLERDLLAIQADADFVLTWNAAREDEP